MQVIGLYDEPDYVVQVLLDNVLYFLHFSWNGSTTPGFWTMGVEDFNRNVLVASIKVIPNIPLLRRYRTASLPAGELVVLSASPVVGRTDFVDNYATMVYVTEVEL